MKLRSLDDLVADVPAYVALDPASAWRHGARRRWRARVVTGAAVVLVVLLAVAGLGVVPLQRTAQPVGSHATVDGYPERIENPYRLAALPVRPGPVAGLLESSSQVLAVSATGHLWRLDGIDDAGPVGLSDDGRWVADLGADLDGYELHDLVSGSTTRFGRLGEDSRRDRFLVDYDEPALWSPDDTHVLVPGAAATQHPVATELLLGTDGSLHTVRPRAGGAWQVAGWVDSGTIAWVSASARDQAVLTSTTGTVLRRIDVPLPRAVGPWTASVSPDGRLLALRSGTAPATLRSLDLHNPMPAGVRPWQGANECPLAWRGDEPLYTGTSSGAAGDAVLLTTADRRRLVLAYPELGVECSVWASNALTGSRHRGLAARLFGTSDVPFWWWWREGLVGLLLIGVACTWAIARRDRTRFTRRSRRARRRDSTA